MLFEIYCASNYHLLCNRNHLVETNNYSNNKGLNWKPVYSVNLIVSSGLESCDLAEGLLTTASRERIETCPSSPPVLLLALFTAYVVEDKMDSQAKQPSIHRRDAILFCSQLLKNIFQGLDKQRIFMLYIIHCYFC